MGIIDFLMDNIFLVIIALFFLSSMLAKRKTAQTKNNNQQRHEAGNAQRSTGQQRSPQQRTNQSTQQRSGQGGSLQRSTLPSIRAEEVTNYGSDLAARRNPDRTSEPEFRDYEHAINDALMENNHIYDSSAPTTEGLGDLHAEPWQRTSGSMNSIFGKEPIKDSVVHGMMWSQVFGAPRARKPFKRGSIRD